MKQLSWPNTIRLTLAIQYSSELILLFQRNALPAIEYLNITIENTHTTSFSSVNTPLSKRQLSQASLRETATHLRFLLLRYISLSEFIALIGSVNMPALEELTLVDMYDDTLDRISQFQELCSSPKFFALKNLHFSLYFPQEIEHTWKMSSFNYNHQWPFHNISSYTDEYYILDIDKRYFIPKVVFVIHNCSIDLLLHHKRYFHNSSFATHASAPVRTVRPRLVQWVCDQEYDAGKFRKALQIITSGHVRELRLTYLNKGTNTSMIPSCDVHWNLLLSHIRSVIFKIDTNSIPQYQRTFMVEQILDASPNLSSLQVAWTDFCHCSRKYPNLKHVHILLSGVPIKREPYFDTDRLNELVPHLSVLETGDALLMLNGHLIEFILSIGHRFDQLVYLTVNKNSKGQTGYARKLVFWKKLIAVTQEQLLHGHKVHCGYRVDENAANNSTDITQTTITLSSSSSASSVLSFDDQTTKMMMDILCIHLTILNNTGVCVN
ncbi:unnamed protein product [Adineta ricciae]|uniref:Uncharacterized protein n=2 Tax=Adineta ricciae TaxID=249248 RepID=A0A813ZXP3_ADIRI|nr:unnamed protein product [Adineta ricciae]